MSRAVMYAALATSLASSLNVTDDLNSRYRRASGAVGAAALGVFTHTLAEDKFNSGGDFWLATSQPVGWSDRISASLVNERHPCPFQAHYGKKPTPGMIVAPEMIEACTLCSWASDGNTARRVCLPDNPEGCVPGCLRTLKVWMDADGLNQTGARSADRWESNAHRGGPFAPGDLAKMLAAHDRRINDTTRALRTKKNNQRAEKTTNNVPFCHNEIVLSAECWARHLPSSVVAFWVPWRRSGDCDEVLANFRRFDVKYNLTVPVVLFDERRGATPFAAFHHHHHHKSG